MSERGVPACCSALTFVTTQSVSHAMLRHSHSCTLAPTAASDHTAFSTRRGLSSMTALDAATIVFVERKFWVSVTVPTFERCSQKVPKTPGCAPRNE